MAITSHQPVAQGVRADEIFRAHQAELFRQTDQLFAGLMCLQWIAGIAFAFLVSPRTWAGAASWTHVHVWAAVLLGGTISLFPAMLGWLRPGMASTRYVIAIAQMLMSALLIHLAGGRIETHFHVFVSLAFLAFYRDWRILVPATIVVALDHALRGLYWPLSVYGVLVASPWRWLEHAAWVIFEDVVLVVACLRGTRELREIAERTAILDFEIRTRQLLERAWALRRLAEWSRQAAANTVTASTRELIEVMAREHAEAASQALATLETTDSPATASGARPGAEAAGPAVERGRAWADVATAFFGLAAEIEGDSRQRVPISPSLATKAGAEARRLAEALRQAHT